MKGKLYLSNCYNMNHVPDGTYLINIARKDMEDIWDKRIELAPSKELFTWYINNKNKVDWFDDYKKIYLNQLKVNKKALNTLSEIREMLDSGKNVCLMCFCKDVTKCHRSLVGNLFVKKGYEVIYK